MNINDIQRFTNFFLSFGYWAPFSWALPLLAQTSSCATVCKMDFHQYGIACVKYLIAWRWPLQFRQQQVANCYLHYFLLRMLHKTRQLNLLWNDFENSFFYLLKRLYEPAVGEANFGVCCWIRLVITANGRLPLFNFHFVFILTHNSH